MNVNTGDVKKLKEVMEKERMNWRSFAAQPATNAAWNDPLTPSYYVLDPKGVIRFKWVGIPGPALEKALEKLTREATSVGKGAPK